MKRVLWSFLLALFYSYAAAYDLSRPINPTDTSNLESAIHSKLNYVLAQGNVTSKLTPNDLANLPIGIESQVGGLLYYIIVDSVRFTPEAAYLNAYASLEHIQSGKRLAFAATNIKFQPGGLAATVSSKLKLVSPKKIQVGNKIDLIITPDGRNYVEFDCNGFKSVNVKGLFEFSRDLLLPEDPAEENVKAVFEGNFTDLNNIIASISISPFRPKQFKDISITVSQAIIDLSDLQNPTQLMFPPGYHEDVMDDVLWEGFFIKSARVTLPKKLHNSSQEIAIDAQNLIIDRNGFSGNIGIANIFTTEEGNMNGWPLSIDSLGFHFVKNQLLGGAFTGEMIIPPFDKETPAKYKALIFSEDDRTEYQFALQTTGRLKASVLAADVALDPGSTIVVREENGSFKPEAMLHGSISVKSGEKLNVNQIKFQDLHLASEKPYIRSATWALTGKGEQSAGKYPISIQHLSLKHNEDQLRLSLNIALNLMNSEDKGFSANSTVIVHGELSEETIVNGEQTYIETNWHYTRTTIADIALAVETNAFSLSGSLAFYEADPTYGNGFRGEIGAKFAGFAITSVGQFGKVDGFRYWYVDAMVTLPSPVGSGFGIYGMGGGMSYHMAKEENFLNKANEFEDVTGDKDKKEIGASRSLSVYKPNKDVGLGFKAAVIVGIMPKADPFNGVVTFEMEFYSGGGVRHIRFMGDAYFMKPLNADPSVAQMSANLKVQMDFENKELHGELVTYVNVQDAIKGIHENNKAGLAVMHIAKDEWYMHVGTPEQRIGLNFIGLVEANSYFMMGTYLHDFPDVGDVIPAELVADIEDDLSGFMRDENALATGGGLAFGASLKVSTGRQQVLMFYGLFDAGFGFDLMLRDYGDVRCEGDSKPIGINGWYASGQSWMYVQAEIGINVNLTFVKGDFVIASMGMASIVQAKLPNPLYLQGFVNGYYNILGGLVKGKFNFKFTIGEECTLVGKDATSTDIRIIADISPGEGKEVDVFAVPQVAFNVPIGKVFTVMDGESEKVTAYKVKLDRFIVKNASSEIQGEVEWSDDLKTMIFNSFEILPEKSKLSLEVKVSWLIRENNIWSNLGGKNPVYEEKKITFQTGQAPNYIPQHNVAFSYPVNTMYNFYPKEVDHGYIILKKGQSYLFNDPDFTYEQCFFKDIVPLKSKASYDSIKKKIHFAIPSGFVKESGYTVKLIKTPKSNYKVDQNVEAILTKVEDAEVGEVNLETRQITKPMLLENDQLLYEAALRTSKFDSFKSKLDAYSFSSTSEIDEQTNLLTLGLVTYASEAFDELEVNGTPETKQLIRLTALPDNRWFNEKAFPLNYEHYPVSSGMEIDWRVIEPEGIPPLNAVYSEQQAELLLFESKSHENTNGYLWFSYELPHFIFYDFKNLQGKAFDQYYATGKPLPKGAERLMLNNYPSVTSGEYRVNVQYILPGTKEPTTSKTYTIIRK